jgi:uroporphyrinogen decarboxylase
MLALVDNDVLDALGCDVATISRGVTNVLDLPERWHDYDFGARLAARVLDPTLLEATDDGGFVMSKVLRMPATSTVFDAEHGGHPTLDLDQPLPLLDLKQLRRETEAEAITDEEIRRMIDLARATREATDRAILVNEYFGSGISIAGHAGIGIFPIICKLEPDYVREYHEIAQERRLRVVRAVLPEVRDYVDIVRTASDDWGTQKSTIASPETFRTLFLPYYRRYNAEVRRLAPGVKTAIHTCGAVYDLLDLFVESGFDVINPIQWPAGGHGYREWKDRLRGRATMWGGGVNTQGTLVHGSVEDVEREVEEIVAYCRKDGGFVFNNIHNVLAETDPAKVIAMYRAAGARVTGSGPSRDARF